VTRAAAARCVAALVVVAACTGPSSSGATSDGRDGGSDPGAPPPGVDPPVAPDASCTAPGCLRSAAKTADYPKAALVSAAAKEVVIDNGYEAWAVEYVTGDRTSLATVALPLDVPPPPGGFAIVANNHGTTGVDDACAVTGTAFGAGLAGVFGARGMIGVASDYPGIGTPGVHPYLVSDVEGRAALDALRAARALARWRGMPTSGRFGVAGVSQGGHATLAAAALHATHAPELDIRGFAAVAPSSLFEEQWRGDLSQDGPPVLWNTMLVYAWADHYGYDGPSPWAPGIEPTVRTAMTSSCAFPLNGAGSIAASLGLERAKIFAPAFVLAYESGDWGAYAPFSAWFTANRVRPYRQTAPLVIYQGDRDPIVPEARTSAVVGALRAGGVAVDYEIVAGGSHTDVAFGLVTVAELRTQDSIAWLRERLDAP
jgi:dienelactone hydrolase